MYSILSCASRSEVRSVLRTTSIIIETRVGEDYIMIHNGHNTYQDLLQSVTPTIYSTDNGIEYTV